MKTIFIVREEESDDGTFSKMYVDDEIFYTAELPWRDNRTDVSCVPLGEYICERITSPHFGTAYRLLDVKGRTNILIHKGNWAGDIYKDKRTDSEGCILIGMGLSQLEGQRVVHSSMAAFDRFMKIVNDKQFKLVISTILA